MPELRGRSINVFLPARDAAGVLRCSIANWIGVAYRVPRTELDAFKSREELNYNGVYLLFGEDAETGKGIVYVGQAQKRKTGGGLMARLLEHSRNEDEDYWTEVVVLTTINDSFGPTEISYLENRFCNLAGEAHRYTIRNRLDPTPGNLTEPKRCEMEDYIDDAKLVIRTMGYRVFEPISAPVCEDREQRVVFRLQRTVAGDTVSAEGIRTAEGFAVLRGSRIRLQEDEGIPAKIKVERRSAAKSEDGVLLEDVLFTSPSYAAIFVIGKSENGQTAWKTTDSLAGREITLKEFEAQQITGTDPV